MELNNKKVMVVGTGISGIGAIDLLNKAGADCIIYDGNEKLSREDISKKLKGNKAEIIIGKLPQHLQLHCRLHCKVLNQPFLSQQLFSPDYQA